MTDPDPRPEGCCGVCPPIVGGGYDCTCASNPRCPNTNPAALARKWNASDLTEVEVALPSALAQRDDALAEVERLRAAVERVRALAERWANLTIKIDGQSVPIHPEYVARVIRRALNGEA